MRSSLEESTVRKVVGLDRARINMIKSLVVFVAFLFFSGFASAQTDKPLTVRVVYDKSDPSSAAVGALLAQKVAAQPKFFTIATGDDKNLAIVTDCYRATSSDPYSCFYVATKWIETNQALLGAAVAVGKSADDAATSMFTDILQDVAERWNSTNRQMLITELETCLVLTESSCAVPDPLVAELEVKSVNLSQYARRGGLK
jgi:hypothetical protein